MSALSLQNVDRTVSTTDILASPKRDIIISLIFTESTSSLLNLDLPHLEDLEADQSETSICVIEAENSIEDTDYLKPTKLYNFTRYWFNNHMDSEKTECERVSSTIAYFRSQTKFRDSVESILSLDQLEKKDPNTEESSTDLQPLKVYTRPLVTVRSLAHKNLIKSEKNTIFINILNSTVRMTESGWINVCRICHGGESFGDLLSPCDCRGSIALAHMECLERWLKESTNSKCELCQHRFHIIRQPKYSVPRSIFVFLRHPGDHLNELLYDLFAFIVYTPAAIASTYMLMLLCETIAKNNNDYSYTVQAHITTLASVFGMAAIDFTYSSWFMVNMQKHIFAWRSWYRNSCDVKVVLPANKLRRMRNLSPIELEEALD